MSDYDSEDESGVGPGLMINLGSRNSASCFRGGDLIRYPTVVGKRKLRGGYMQDRYAGETAFGEHSYPLNLHYPIEGSRVEDWDNWELLIWHSFFEVLREIPEENAVLMTVPVNWSKLHYDKMSQILFETFDVLSLHVLPQPVAGLIGSLLSNNSEEALNGKALTGLVIDFGVTTRIVPIQDGVVVEEAVEEGSWGCENLDKAILAKLMTSGLLGVADASTMGANVNDMDRIKLMTKVREAIKEVHCRVAFSPEGSSPSVSDEVEERQIQWNEERSLTIPWSDREWEQVTESLFHSSFSPDESLGGLLVESMRKLVSSQSVEAAHRILGEGGGCIVIGGCSELPGMEARIREELSRAKAAAISHLDWKEEEAKWAALAALTAKNSSESSRNGVDNSARYRVGLMGRGVLEHVVSYAFDPPIKVVIGGKDAVAKGAAAVMKGMKDRETIGTGAARLPFGLDSHYHGVLNSQYDEFGPDLASVAFRQPTLRPWFWERWSLEDSRTVVFNRATGEQKVEEPVSPLHLVFPMNEEARETLAFFGYEVGPPPSLE
jgi:hypothetical protein